MKTLINDFSKIDKHFRANLINSVIGVKQASLIGTVGSNGISNLALFSSTVHLGSNPPLVAIFSRPEGDAPKQTLNNIIDISSIFNININDNIAPIINFLDYSNNNYNITHENSKNNFDKFNE